MKYDKKFPDLSTGKEKEGIINSTMIRACCVCGNATNWRDVLYIDYICSEECRKIIDVDLKLAYLN